jgi:hypothetical protein
MQAKREIYERAQVPAAADRGNLDSLTEIGKGLGGGGVNAHGSRS